MKNDDKKNLKSHELKNAALDDAALDGVAGGVNSLNQMLNDDLARVRENFNQDREH